MLGLAWLAATLNVVRAGEFGQREHMFILAAGPMFFLRVLRREGVTVPVWLALAIGAAASATACLKPHFIVILAIIELTLLFKSRDPRSLLAPEAVAFYAVILAYLGHWLLLPAAARQYFFGRHLQLVAAGYSTYNAPLEWVLLWASRKYFVFAVSAIVLAAFAMWKARRPFIRRLLLATIAGIVGGIISYVTQHKGWSYHRIPFVCFSIFTLAAAYCQGIHRLSGSDRQRLRRAVITIPLMAALVGASGLFALISRMKAIDRGVEDLEALMIKETKPGDQVLFVSPLIQPAYPLVFNLDRRPGSRYPASFPIAFSYGDVPRDAPAEAIDYLAHGRGSPLEQEFLESLREDIRKRRPRMVCIQDAEECYSLPVHFNLRVYLEQTGIVALLRELGYREESLRNHWAAFIAP